MGIPSVPEAVDALKEVSTIISEGGSKAYVFLFLFNLVFIIGGSYFCLRYLLNHVKELIDTKEKQLLAKDEIINTYRQRADSQNEQYARLSEKMIAAEQAHSKELQELRTLVTSFLTTRSYNR